MIRKYYAILGLIAMLCVALGCSPTLLDENWGRSYHAAKNSQVLDPDAHLNLEPVEGIDGQAVSLGVANYRESFATQSARSAAKPSVLEAITGVNSK